MASKLTAIRSLYRVTYLYKKKFQPFYTDTYLAIFCF